MLTSWEITCVGGSAVRYKVRRKLLSQNFLHSRTLVANLVRNSSIGQNDTVLEIGPGRGITTHELLYKADKVIAVEIDLKLVSFLLSLFSDVRLSIYNTDFLKFQLPNYPYKVFSNIPFSIEGDIVRKLLGSENPPEDCYLVIDARLAKRLSGLPHENQFSLKHKPWFEFSIEYNFKRSDFVPIPRVESVLWRIKKKDKPLISIYERRAWCRFIKIGFGEGGAVKNNLKKVLSSEHVNTLSNRVSFSLKAKPGYLKSDQWLVLFENLKKMGVKW